MSMAKPIDCPITSDYTEGNRPLPSIALWIYNYDVGKRLRITIPPAKGSHLGIDYALRDGSTVGMPVNSAEAGKVRDKRLEVPEAGLVVIVEDDRRVPDQIWREAEVWGYQVELFCYLPSNDEFIFGEHTYIGAHRLVEHGWVNLKRKNIDGSTLEEQYERDKVTSAYGHTMENPPGLPPSSSQVDISTRITVVRDLYVVDPSHPDESLQLSLGYVEFQNTILDMWRWTGGGWVLVKRWLATVRVPSFRGAHLHFEVREERKRDHRGSDNRWVDADNDGVIRPWGQWNPHHYLHLPYGGR
jgi:hypothetical protein